MRLSKYGSGRCIEDQRLESLVGVHGALATCLWAALLMQGCIPLRQPEPDLAALIREGEAGGQRVLVLPLIETWYEVTGVTKWSLGEPKVLEIEALEHTRGVYAEFAFLHFHPLTALHALLPQDSLVELCLVFDRGQVQSVVHGYARNAFSPWVTQARGSGDRKWLERLNASVQAAESVEIGKASDSAEGARCFFDVRGKWFDPTQAALAWTMDQRRVVSIFLSQVTAGVAGP